MVQHVAHLCFAGSQYTGGTRGCFDLAGLPVAHGHQLRMQESRLAQCCDN